MNSLSVVRRLSAPALFQHFHWTDVAWMLEQGYRDIHRSDWKRLYSDLRAQMRRGNPYAGRVWRYWFYSGAVWAYCWTDSQGKRFYIR